MSAWTNQICILYWNLQCTMYTLLYTVLYTEINQECTHKLKWLVWLTYFKRKIPLLANWKLDLTLDFILSWTLYCILYCTLYCMMYTVSYTIYTLLQCQTGWLKCPNSKGTLIFLSASTTLVLKNVLYNVLNT